jgi:hypothetical protein
MPHWFSDSDLAVEEALYDSCAMCEFVGFDLGREPVPDERRPASVGICSRPAHGVSRSSTRSTPT